MLVFGDAVIFQGSNVKALKPNLDLNGQSKIMSGTVDPTVTATSANKGSQYLNTSSGVTYIKRDNGSSTNWDVAGNVENQEMVHQNMLSGKGAGFEYGVADWTASGGTLAAVTSGSNLLSGRGSATWDSSAASQTLKSALISIPKGLYGASGMIRCKSQTPSGVATHKIQVYDGTNVIGEQTLASLTTPVNQTVNFIFPSSGSIQIQFTSVAADEPLIAVDDCYIGSATNLSEVSQAEVYGTQLVPGASNCSQTLALAAWTQVPVDADCGTPVLTGYADTTAGKRPAISFPSLPPGKYEIEIQFERDSVAGDSGCSYSITDGTTIGAPVGDYGSIPYANIVKHIFEYTTAQSAKTFALQVYNSSGAGDCVVRAASGSISSYYAVAKRFPTSSQTVYSPDTFSSSWAGYHAYSASCLWSRTNTAFGDFTGDADCNLVETVNQNFGSVTSYGGATEQPGLVFTPIRSGLYEICAEGQFYNSASAFSALRLTADGSTQIAAQALDMVTGTYTPFKLCGFHRVSSTSQVSIRLEGRSSSGTLNIGGSSSAGQNVVEWTIKQIEQAIPAPVYAGSSISGIEYACNTGMGNVDDTTSFSNAEDGCPFPVVTYSTSRAKRIRFLNNTKSSDTLQFQIKNSGASGTAWVTLDSGSFGLTHAYLSQNGTEYGAGRINWISQTDFDVQFGRYRYNTAATFGGAGTDWSAGMAGYNWRVVKYSNAVPVNSQVTGYVSAAPSDGSIARIEYGIAYTTNEATACSSSPCAIRASTGISSVTRASAGQYTLNFSPAFAAAPVCYIVPSSGLRYVTVGSYTTTTALVQTFTGTIGAPSSTDVAFNFQCIGAK